VKVANPCNSGMI